MSSASSSTPSSCGRTARATRRSASFWRGLATVPSTPTPTRTSPSRRSSRAWTDQAVPELVAAAASRCPDAPAVAGPDGTLTYAELVGAAAQVAGRLRRLGVAREHVVAVCLARGAGLVATLLGIWGAGAAYL